MRAIWLAVALAGAGLVTACKDAQKPTEVNLAPTANFASSCQALRCDFQDTSTDDGSIVSWSWSFGAEGSSQRNPIYNYPSAGSYQAPQASRSTPRLTASVICAPARQEPRAL